MSYTLVHFRLQTDRDDLGVWRLYGNGNLASDGNSKTCERDAGIRPDPFLSDRRITLSQRYSGTGIYTCVEKM